MSGGERQVVDMNGMRYRLGRQLGQGGQGAVFEVEGGKLAAKLVFDRSASRRDRLRNQLLQVKRLALGDLELARPLEMLRNPHVGYVMELLTGMVPLKRLTHLPREELSLTQWYLSGGGLRRRLRLLARTADLLSQLHGKGLVYSDPSPHNIFVSAAPDGHELRLIDADNLHYQSPSATTGIYTPGYGAPELVRGLRGVDTLTDAHAFAVIAFQTLAQVHPLLGDTVTEGEPEQEEAALRGEFPWIDHPEDERNRSSLGIPRDVVLSPRLKELCQHTFGRGLTDRLARPGLSTWAERLHAAADATLGCPGCGGTYYVTASACPWCDSAKPAYVLASFLLSDPVVISCGACRTGYTVEEAECPRCRTPRPEGVNRTSLVRGPDPGRKRQAQAVLTEQTPLVITERLATGHIGRGSNAPRLEVRLQGRRLWLKSLDGSVYPLSSKSGTRSNQVGEQAVDFPLEAGQGSWRLHLGKLEQLHRIVGFELRTEGR
ncbi:protein kinase domain-containing protein [Archangium violaceum]|uniref:protein kinase domain-containing protein n=1 Tax=Archangium violaceum TaxID=83451 RepID=UPI000695B451|nr:hypothetical protein [Archangium violaceum]